MRRPRPDPRLPFTAALLLAAFLLPCPWYAAAQDLPLEAALRGDGTGFCGADGAYSIPLGKDRAVWLFGDTFLGRIEGGRRAGCTLVNNTVALATRDNAGAWSFLYRWRTAGGRPTAFFPPLSPGRYFWPLHGILRDGTLHVFLMEIEGTGMGEAFAFRLCGNALASIDNPGDDPHLWRMRMRRVPHARFRDETLIWGGALLASGAATEVYGYRENKEKDGTVRRELLRAVAPRDPERFEKWRIDPRPLADEVAVEFSVTPLAGGGRLLCHTRGLADPTAILRRARRPGAPFGPADPLFTPPLPEGRRGFAYAAKLHPECETADGALLTWVVNSFDFGELFSDASLYFPRATRVRIAP